MNNNFAEIMNCSHTLIWNVQTKVV